MRTPSLSLSLALVLAVPAAAQERGALPSLGETAVFRNVGLHMLDGELVGAGPEYAVRFEAGTFRYTPAFGTAAPRTMPWHFRLEAVGRGEGREPVGVPERSFRDFLVRYLRPGFEERYELRLEGVEQSFVFHELPPGKGDLVVRGRVETELLCRVEGSGLRFPCPGIGAVTVGGVTGIDAKGRRVRGAMRWEGGILEMILPGDFVDAAVLPLVLDPLIGTEITVSGSSTAIDQDVAALSSTNPPEYFVVWEHVLSATGSDIRGQHLRNGLTHGGVTILTSGVGLDKRPRVATVRQSSNYLVVWRRIHSASHSGILARTVGPTGPAAVVVPLSGGAVQHMLPDVGGDAHNLDQATVVWLTQGQPGVSAMHVRVAANGAITGIAASAVLNPTQTVEHVAISKSAGVTGNHLVVFQRSGGLGIGGVIIDGNMAALEDRIDISGTGFDDWLPDVDGDGRNWVVAWERRESPASFERDIFCRAVAWNPNAPLPDQGYLVSPVMPVEADPVEDEQHPAVAWLGGSVLIAYADDDNSRYDVLVRSVDPFRCTACEGLLHDAFAGSLRELTPAVCASSLRAFHSDSALVTARLDGAASQIQARWFSAGDGVHSERFCSSGGFAHASCARIGNPNFDLRLTSARASALAFLVLGVERADRPCGGCSLIPNPWTGVVLGSLTNARGDALQSLAIPNDPGLIGLSLFTQWLVADPACTTCCFGFALSPSATVTLQ